LASRSLDLGGAFALLGRRSGSVFGGLSAALHDGDEMRVDIVLAALKLIEVFVGVDDEFSQVVP